MSYLTGQKSPQSKALHISISAEHLPVLQVEGRSSVIETFKQLLAEEGVWGMTKGLSARIISSTPTSLLIVVGYETLKRLSLRAELVETRHWWKATWESERNLVLGFNLRRQYPSSVPSCWGGVLSCAVTATSHKTVLLYCMYECKRWCFSLAALERYRDYHFAIFYLESGTLLVFFLFFFSFSKLLLWNLNTGEKNVLYLPNTKCSIKKQKI